MLGRAEELLFHLIRALVKAGNVEQSAEPLEKLRRVAPGRPNAEAFLAWAQGLPDEDPARLRAAISAFSRLGRVVDEARCLVDLAEVLRSSGNGDGRVEDDRARELLTAHGVEVYLPMVPEASANDRMAREPT